MLTAIGVVITLAALVLGFFKVDYENWIGGRRVSYRRAKSYIEDLLKILSAHNRSIDYIVCFPDGGLSVADMCSFVEGKRITTISLSLRAVSVPGTKKQVVVDSPFVAEQSLKGDGTILVVDDACRSGATLSAVVEYLKDIQNVDSERIFTAVLGKLESSAGYQPNWSGFEFSKKAIFPWGETPKM